MPFTLSRIGCSIPSNMLWKHRPVHRSGFAAMTASISLLTLLLAQLLDVLERGSSASCGQGSGLRELRLDIGLRSWRCSLAPTSAEHPRGSPEPIPACRPTIAFTDGPTCSRES